MTDHEPLLEAPIPAPEFADRLRNRLRALDAAARRPGNLWVMVAAYAAAGLVLLIVAVAGVGI
jgi:hypothetical protein